MLNLEPQLYDSMKVTNNTVDDGDISDVSPASRASLNLAAPKAAQGEPELVDASPIEQDAPKAEADAAVAMEQM